MGSKICLVFLVLFIFAIGNNTWGQGFYKWIDEKGVVHFSEDPPTVIPKNQGKDQDKTQVKSEAKKQAKKQDKTLDTQTTKEDSSAILKGLEVGNRTIPKDMRKYGPAG